MRAVCIPSLALSKLDCLPMKCAVCHCDIDAAEEKDGREAGSFLSCTCGLHALHHGDCSDSWLESALGLNTTLLDVGKWPSLPGCPICTDAPPFDPEGFRRSLLPAISHGCQGAILTAVFRAHEPGSGDGHGARQTAARRIANTLLESAVLRCPSCHVGFEIDLKRGCDAVWCQNRNCRRAFCLWCLRDCGDHAKRDTSADSPDLVGDAHEHIRANDCGLTGGNLFAGDALVRYHEARHRKEVAICLKRLPPELRDEVSCILGIDDSACNLDLSGNSAVLVRHAPAPRPEAVLRWQRSFLGACHSGNLEVARSFLSTGVDPACCDENHPYCNGLQFAAHKGHAAVVRMLLHHKVSPYYKDSLGRAALHHSVNTGAAHSLEIIQALVRACLQHSQFDGDTHVPWQMKMNGGSSVRDLARNSPSEVKAYFDQLETGGVALLFAACSRDIAKVRDVLKSSPAEVVWVRDTKTGDSALHFASTKAAPEIVEALLEAEADVTQRSKVGLTPLHCIAWGGRESGQQAVAACVSIAQQLFKAGGHDVLHMVSHDGRTALDVARDLGFDELASVLLTMAHATR